MSSEIYISIGYKYIEYDIRIAKHSYVLIIIKEGLESAKDWLLINEDRNFISPWKDGGLESGINSVMYLDVLLISIIIT